jgi:hypothetical protein
MSLQTTSKGEKEETNEKGIVCTTGSRNYFIHGVGRMQRNAGRNNSSKGETFPKAFCWQNCP